MFGLKKELKVRSSSRSKEGSRGDFPDVQKSKKEFGWYEVPGEVGKAFRKLFYLAIILFVAWFFYECVRSWNIFS